MTRNGSDILREMFSDVELTDQLRTLLARVVMTRLDMPAEAQNEVRMHLVQTIAITEQLLRKANEIHEMPPMVSYLGCKQDFKEASPEHLAERERLNKAVGKALFEGPWSAFGKAVHNSARYEQAEAAVVVLEGRGTHVNDGEIAPELIKTGAHKVATVQEYMTKAGQATGRGTYPLYVAYIRGRLVSAVILRPFEFKRVEGKVRAVWSGEGYIRMLDNIRLLDAEYDMGGMLLASLPDIPPWWLEEN